MYKKQIEHMMTRFDEAKRYIKSHMKLELILKNKGKTKVDFCKDFEENSEYLHQIALYLARQITNTEASSYSYAAAIAVIAEELGYEYEVYAGLAVNKIKTPEFYKKMNKDDYDDYALPSLANYVVTKVDNTYYDYLEGFEGIEHIYMTKQENI